MNTTWMRWSQHNAIDQWVTSLSYGLYSELIGLVRLGQLGGSLGFWGYLVFCIRGFSKLKKKDDINTIYRVILTPRDNKLKIEEYLESSLFRGCRNTAKSCKVSLCSSFVAVNHSTSLPESLRAQILQLHPWPNQWLPWTVQLVGLLKITKKSSNFQE